MSLNHDAPEELHKIQDRINPAFMDDLYRMIETQKTEENMRKESGSRNYETAMEGALAEAGIKSAKQQAVEMVDRHWQEHKPDIEATIRAFAEELQRRYPIMVAIVYASRLAPCIQAFVRGNHPEIRKLVQRRAGLLSIKARIEKVGYSTNPSSIRSRKRARLQRGTNDALHPVLPTGVTSALYNISSRASYHRRRAGINRVKLDIAADGKATLVSKLPVALVRLQINGKPILDCLKDEVLKWCETHAKLVEIAHLWAWLTPDPRKTLGEQLTAEIVEQLSIRDAA